MWRSLETQARRTLGCYRKKVTGNAVVGSEEQNVEGSAEKKGQDKRLQVEKRTPVGTAPVKATLVTLW